MDQRQTFETLEELKTMLSNLHSSQAAVSLLIDRDGLTRVEGIISSINDQNKPLAETTFSIGSHKENAFYLHEVIAVNGIFSADYTEC